MSDEQSTLQLQAFLLGAMVTASHVRGRIAEGDSPDVELQRIFTCAQKILTSQRTLEALSISNPRTDLEMLARVIRGTSTVAEAAREAESVKAVLPQLTVARFSTGDRENSSMSSHTSRRPR